MVHTILGFPHMAGFFLIGRVALKESLDFTMTATVGGFLKVAANRHGVMVRTGATGKAHVRK